MECTKMSLTAITAGKEGTLAGQQEFAIRHVNMLS